MTEDFFKERLEQSAVKTAIVANYFEAWSKVIMGFQDINHDSNKKIAYIDLFSGPGQYANGDKSTPIIILEKAIKSPQLRNRLLTYFNDKNVENTKLLTLAIQSLPNVGLLKHTPEIRIGEVDEEVEKKCLKIMNQIPALVFLDPWGYKGLSLRFIDLILKNWGCECIFFFNYNRINPAIENPSVQIHMDALFGQQRAMELSQKLEFKSPDQREDAILDEISQNLIKKGYSQVIPFGFKNLAGTRTKHYLFYVSKNSKGER